MNKVKAGVIFFLSWLFPGSGHFLQKKVLRGTVFLTGILLLMGMGLVMKGSFYTIESQGMHPLKVLGLLGDLGSGVFFFLIKLSGLGEGDIARVTHGYGTAYLVTAGLLNYLVALNAHDIALGRRR